MRGSGRVGLLVREEVLERFKEQASSVTIRRHLETHSAWIGTDEGRPFVRVNCEPQQAICDDHFEGKSHVLSFSSSQTLVTP